MITNTRRTRYFCSNNEIPLRDPTYVYAVEIFHIIEIQRRDKNLKFRRKRGTTRVIILFFFSNGPISGGVRRIFDSQLSWLLQARVDAEHDPFVIV